MEPALDLLLRRRGEFTEVENWGLLIALENMLDIFSLSSNQTDFSRAAEVAEALRLHDLRAALDGLASTEDPGEGVGELARRVRRKVEHVLRRPAG